KRILNKKHKEFVDSIKDEEVQKLVRKNSIITGGAITSMLLNEPVNDFDYYFTDKETTLKVAEYFVSEFKKTHKLVDVEVKEDESKAFEPVFLTKNAISLNGKIQLVIRFYGEPEQIHDNYDFIHATCYWRSENNHLSLPREALEAILTRELKYAGSKYPLASI